MVHLDETVINPYSNTVDHVRSEILVMLTSVSIATGDGQERVI